MSSLPKNLDNIKVENYEWVEHQGCVVVKQKFQWENPNSGQFLFSIKYVTFNVGKKTAQYIARLHNDKLAEIERSIKDLEWFASGAHWNKNSAVKAMPPESS